MPRSTGGARRLLALLAVGVSALALAACGSSASSSSDAAPAAEKDGKFTIGYDIYWVGNSWSAQMAEEFKAAVTRNSSKIEDVVYTESDNQVQKQISNIQTMIARKVDAIIMTPISPSATVPVIKQAEAAGIPVILVAAEANTDAYTSIVRADDVVFGRTGAEWLAEKLGGKGNIYVLNGLPGYSTNTNRFKGAKEAFKKYPGIKIVADADAAWDTAKAKTAVSNMLAAHPEVDGIWSQGGAMTLGAIQAFKAAKKELVPMSGENSNGLLKEWQKLGEAGDTKFDSIAVVNPTWVSAEALTQALNALEGKPVKKDDIINPEPITAAKLGEFVRPDLPDSFWVDTKLSDEQVSKLFAR